MRSKSVTCLQMPRSESADVNGNVQLILPKPCSHRGRGPASDKARLPQGTQLTQTDQRRGVFRVNMSKSSADSGPNPDPNCSTLGLPLLACKKDFQLENLRCWKNKFPKGESMRCS